MGTTAYILTGSRCRSDADTDADADKKLLIVRQSRIKLFCILWNNLNIFDRMKNKMFQVSKRVSAFQ